MKRRLAALGLILSLLLFAAHAGAETPIVFNPDSAPATAEETAAPVDAVITPEGEYTLQVNPSEELTVSSFLERADPDMVCVGKIRYSELR